MTSFKKKMTEEEAKLKMADLCARSEQCAYDISQKLYRYGLFKDQRERIIDFLIEKRFIDEERFARSYARDKCRFSSWGPYKIRQGLALKRISSSAISEALDAIEDEEWENAALKAANSKSRGLDLNGEEKREHRIKLYRFMLTRGFESQRSKEMVLEMAKTQREKKG